MDRPGKVSESVPKSGSEAKDGDLSPPLVAGPTPYTVYVVDPWSQKLGHLVMPVSLSGSPLFQTCGLLEKDRIQSICLPPKATEP